VEGWEDGGSDGAARGPLYEQKTEKSPNRNKRENLAVALNHATSKPVPRYAWSKIRKRLIGLSALEIGIEKRRTSPSTEGKALD